jgi:hypothetical protein
MIYIELMGGLGNQLFQIFCGISYSLDNKIPFKILKNKNDKVSPLDNISLRPTYFDNFLSNISKFTCDNVNLPLLKESGLFVYKKIPLIEKDFKLHGYFQNINYFNNNYDNICKFINIDYFKNNIKLKYNNYFQNKLPISLHFRIGDYVKNTSFHPILNINYYIESIKYLYSNLNNIDENYYLLIFGEEINNKEINENIEKLKLEFPNLEIVICEYNIEDWKQMILMSLCSHNIIANSSFSWWSAYFNNNSEKFVCYPSIWNGSVNNINGLFPEKWNKF